MQAHPTHYQSPASRSFGGNLPLPDLDVTGGHWPPAPLNAFRTSARSGLDVAGPRCRRWPFATCATRYLPYGHLPAAVQAGLGGPRWAIDISNNIFLTPATAATELCGLWLLDILYGIPESGLFSRTFTARDEYRLQLPVMA